MIEKFADGKLMQTLKLDRRAFYRFKSGQTAAEVEKTLEIPAASPFAGQILIVSDCIVHIAEPFETYASIAKKYGIDEHALKNFNGSRPLYPSRKIFIPRI